VQDEEEEEEEVLLCCGKCFVNRRWCVHIHQLCAYIIPGSSPTCLLPFLDLQTTPEPEPAVPTTPDKAVKDTSRDRIAERSDDEEPDGIFSFKRKPHIKYHSVSTQSSKSFVESLLLGTNIVHVHVQV